MRVYVTQFHDDVPAFSTALDRRLTALVQFTVGRTSHAASAGYDPSSPPRIHRGRSGMGDGAARRRRGTCVYSFRAAGELLWFPPGIHLVDPGRGELGRGWLVPVPLPDAVPERLFEKGGG